MFGRSHPVVIERYGRRRSRWHVPRWIVLLLWGVALGAAGVVLIQERYLEPRLSAAASAALRKDFATADADSKRLQLELGETQARLEIALAERKGQAEKLAAGLASAARAREDLALVVDALPADPRGGDVAVRAARFAVKGGSLAYDVVLTRERATGQAMPGLMQFVVAGQAARGGETTVTLPPIAIALGGLQVLRGSVALPEGFTPRQATVQVLDRAAGRTLGMRVLLVR
jgi:hypothetical protein